MPVAAPTVRIPYTNATLLAVVPSDTVTYDPPLLAVYVGGAAGAVALTRGAVSGDDVVQGNVTYATVPAGGTVGGVGPITAVRATGTTATGLIGIT